jgi:RNA polymerase sigma-70 factor (ECF subfamily)
MTDVPATRPSLLVRLRDAGDAIAWSQFVELYGPLLYRLARRHGLQDADAVDLMQDVLQRVAVAIRAFEYDRARSFRAWLHTVACNRLRDWLALRCRRERGSGDSSTQQHLEAIPAPDSESAWDRDYHERIFRYAAEQVRPEFKDTTWQAFWRTAVEGQSGPETAAQLGLSVGAVHVARSRVLARLKELARQLLDEEIPLSGEHP